MKEKKDRRTGWDLNNKSERAKRDAVATPD